MRTPGRRQPPPARSRSRSRPPAGCARPSGPPGPGSGRRTCWCSRPRSRPPRSAAITASTTQLVAMVAFACASAAVYFINDVVDVERDRRHPVKRNRPIASGALPERHAVVLAVLATVFAVGAGVVIRRAAARRQRRRVPVRVLPLLLPAQARTVRRDDAGRERVPAARARRRGGDARPRVDLVPAGLQPGRARGGDRQAVHRADQPGRGRGAAPPGDAVVPSWHTPGRAAARRARHAGDLPDVGGQRDHGRQALAPGCRRCRWRPR